MVKYRLKEKENKTDISVLAMIEIVTYLLVPVFILMFNGYNEYLKVTIGWSGVLILFTLINDYVKEVLVSIKATDIILWWYLVISTTIYINIVIMFMLDIISTYKYVCYG